MHVYCVYPAISKSPNNYKSHLKNTKEKQEKEWMKPYLKWRTDLKCI
jgi:hypothetical protein